MTPRAGREEHAGSGAEHARAKATRRGQARRVTAGTPTRDAVTRPGRAVRALGRAQLARRVTVGVTRQGEIGEQEGTGEAGGQEESGETGGRDHVDERMGPPRGAADQVAVRPGRNGSSARGRSGGCRGAPSRRCLTR